MKGYSEKVEFRKYRLKEQCQSFSLQSEAIKVAASKTNKRLFVFSYETNRGGVRRYVSTDLQTLWKYYKQLELKSYYEVIIQNKSCKLYMDLEFPVEENKDRDGHKMTLSLISLINDYLLDKFGVNVTQDDILVLESSSQRKFSIHLVYFKTYLKDNESCGNLMKQIIEKIIDGKMCEQFQVKDQHGEWKWFFDTTVYSANRNFRLFLSSKLGQSRPLTLSNCDRSTLDLLEDPNIYDIDYEIFLRSLITNVTVGAEVLEIKDRGSPCRVGAMCSGASGSVRHGQVSHTRAVSADRSSGLSPFPHIDKKISDMVSPGYIRCWTFDKYESSVIVYNIAGTKFCHIAGREHTNNHVFYKYYPDSNAIIQACFNINLCKGRKYRVN